MARRCPLIPPSLQGTWGWPHTFLGASGLIPELLHQVREFNQRREFRVFGRPARPKTINTLSTRSNSLNANINAEADAASPWIPKTDHGSLPSGDDPFCIPNRGVNGLINVVGPKGPPPGVRPILPRIGTRRASLTRSRPQRGGFLLPASSMQKTLCVYSGIPALRRPST
jgi:hypothetical protein